MIEKEYKNYYDINFGSHIGVYIDEFLMKKLSKLQYEMQEKIKDLLANNMEHFECANDSLTFPNGEYKYFSYIGMNLFSKEEKISYVKDMFSIRKVEYLYRTDMEWSRENEEKLKKFAQEDMENMESETD